MTKINIPEKYIVVDYNDIDDYNFPLDEEFNLVVFYNNIKCDFIVCFKKNCDELLVLGSGLTPRDKKKLNPYYNRVSWNFKYSTIYFNDPSSYIHDNIYGAWAIGDKDIWYLEVLSKIIQKLCDNVYNYKEDPYNNILFTGSSQGGFMSFMLSVLVKNSYSICDIPQTDILRDYHDSPTTPFNIYKKSIVEFIFDNMDINEIYENYSYRLSFIELIKKEKYIPNALLCLDCSYQIDFEQDYLPFFKQLNQLPFTDESSNNIKIRIDGKNNGHCNMSEKKLKESIDNVINSKDKKFKIKYNNKLSFRLENDCIPCNGFITFFMNNVETDKIKVILNNNEVNAEVNKIVEDDESLYIINKTLKTGIYEVKIKYGDTCSNASKLIVKNPDNIFNYNLFSGSDYSGSYDEMIVGLGQRVESSSEWKFNGKRSFKITKTDNQYIWTDIPIDNTYLKGKHVESSMIIKCDAKLAVFYVFKDKNDNQSFSKAAEIEKTSQVKKITIKSYINENIDKLSLRFWIKDDINSSVYVDNLECFVK